MGMVSFRGLRHSCVIMYIITLALVFRKTIFVGYKECESTLLSSPSRIREIITAKPFVTNPTSTADNLIEHSGQDAILPLIYIITPTKYRTEQKADLTRMSHTLRLVPRIHWIIVEDAKTRSDLVTKFLERCEISYTHLAIESNYTLFLTLKAQGKISKRALLSKGVQQRNYALDWITAYGEFPSVFYFADDDNTYDLRLFEEMRFTKRVSVWSVGLATSAKYETPAVRNGKVVGFVTSWFAGRKFPMDMAAFAVNSEVLQRQNPPRFSNIVIRGFLETSFIEQLNVTLSDLEPKADNCTKVLVWHTRTEKSPLRNHHKVQKLLVKYNLTELEV